MLGLTLQVGMGLAFITLMVFTWAYVVVPMCFRNKRISVTSSNDYLECLEKMRMSLDKIEKLGVEEKEIERDLEKYVHKFGEKKKPMGDLAESLDTQKENPIAPKWGEERVISHKGVLKEVVVWREGKGNHVVIDCKGNAFTVDEASFLPKESVLEKVISELQEKSAFFEALRCPQGKWFKTHSDDEVAYVKHDLREYILDKSVEVEYPLQGYRFTKDAVFADSWTSGGSRFNKDFCSLKDKRDLVSLTSKPSYE